MSRKHVDPNVKAKPAVLIATMNEKTVFSAGGVFCVVMLVLSALGTFMGISLAKNAIQEVDAAAIGMVCIMLFGIGAIIGRKRTYAIYREPPPDDDTSR